MLYNNLRMELPIEQIENIIGYKFKSKAYLTQAFTHSSYAYFERERSNRTIESYERMAFVGDSILKMVLAEHLYNAFPDKNKGELSYMRSNLESRDVLSQVVIGLGLTNYLRIIVDANGLSEHICADFYEAVVCAIYFDGGFVKAKGFILRTLSDTLSSLCDVNQKDSKTLLQEYCQRQNPKKTVDYVKVGQTGSDNNPTFIVDLYVDGQRLCQGVGSSKKAAEQDAASKYIKKQRINTEN